MLPRNRSKTSKQSFSRKLHNAMTQSKLRKNWDHHHPDELRSLQAQVLRRYLARTVLPFSAHYRNLFHEEGISADDVRTLDDLRKIPFTSKRDLLNTDENPNKAREFVLIPGEKELSRRPSTIARALLRGRSRVKEELGREFRPILMTSTTGRSTDPVPFLYTQHDIGNLTIAGTRLMEVCRSEPDFRHMNLFPFAPHLAFWQAHYAGIGFNVFNLSTGGGKAMGTEANIRLMNKIKPEALIGMPTFIYHLLQQAVEEGVAAPQLRKIVLGGEKVPAGTRRKLRALCGALGSDQVDVMATYGLTEAKMAFPECPAAEDGDPTGYHLFPDLVVVEVIDPDTGEPVPENHPGEIVITPLDSRGNVVLRYRTGDCIDGGLTYELCPACGRRLPRLNGRISRVSDIRRLHIDKIKGTLINFNALEHILDDMDHIGAWQIELRKVNDDPLECDELIIHVHNTGNVSRDQLSKAIGKHFHSATEIRPNHVLFHDAATMRTRQGVGEELKEKRFVDHRPETQTPQSVATRSAPALEEPVS